MLILSRKTGQSIVIGENLIVKVVRVGGDQIKLGIQAPRDVPVHGEEIHRDVSKPGGGAAALKSALGFPT